MLLLVFIFGLAIGSFLNVLIFRLPERRTIFGFSRCLKCGKRIKWFDNIPILSFLILKGRCRDCKSKISFQYPLVELLTGFLFLFSFLIYPSGPFLIYILFLICLLITIGFIDFKDFIIWDNLILIGFFVSLFYFLFSVYYLPSGDCDLISCSLKSSLFGILFFAGVFLVIFSVSRGRWLGFGDVKLAALVGFIFGLENSINLFYLTFAVGFFVAIILLGLRRANLKTPLPLGSLMAAAVILFLLTQFSFLDLINQELIFRMWL